MAKSSKKSKQTAAPENTPAAPEMQAQNGNGAEKPALPAKPKTGSAKAGKSGPRSKTAAKSRSATPRKRAAARKPRSAAAAVASDGPADSISDDDIRIRAYFIAEQRMREGLPGDSGNDWLEARRQLQKEAEQRA